MLNFIFGPIGSGKTFKCDKMILDALKNGKRVTLLVPEQEAIEAENRIYDRATQSGAPLERLTVLSFRRLANSAFRTHGGIEYNNPGESGRLILLYKIISKNADTLTIYNKFSDRSLIELILSVCTELKRYCVTPELLTLAAERAETPHLKSKLTDIAKIYGEYCAEISKNYSDSSDDVSRLADIYEKNGAPKDEMFFIDSFNGFTAPELRVIATLIKDCNVTVSLTVPTVKGAAGFMTLEKTEKQLRDLAKEANASVFVIEQLSEKHCHDDFALIRDKLFDNSYYSDGEVASDKLELCKFSDKFSQAEYIAKRVCELVQNGARYKDIAVITRNAESYEGILDLIFQRYGIPIFLSKRNKLTDTAIYRTVSLALQILSDYYNSEDVMSYVKSGICGFDAEEADILESYVCLWQIDKAKWLLDSWSMNPLGFTDAANERSNELLNRLNEIKSRIIKPILTLGNSVNGTDLKSACTALYTFILESGIADYYRLSADPSEITAYNTFITLIETLAEIAADLKSDTKTLSSLLYLMAKNTDYGEIPSSFDRVTAGDASILRCNGIKHVFLTDCENGVFPAGVNDDSFFSDTEKTFLAENGVALSPNISEKNDLETFYFLRSACGTSDTLFASYCTGKNGSYPSLGFKRLCELFPKNRVKDIAPSSSPAERIYSLDNFRDIYRSYRATEYYPMIKALADEFSVSEKTVSNIPLVETYEYISPQIAADLFGADIGMSYSRFESYVSCPFSYFCRYILGIKPKKYGYFNSDDMGTYIHRILEKSINTLFADGNIAKKTDEDINATLSQAFDEVLSGVTGGNINDSEKRFKALISRLFRTLKFISKNIVEEFKNSDFVPKFFELEIDKKAGAVTPLKIKIDEQSQMHIKGKIDRVDTYEKDGKIYVRVLDYKSGNTPHSLANIDYALDTQMLLYLFSIWKSGNKDFARLIGNENAEIIPAGVLYQKSRLPVKSIDSLITLRLPSEDLVRSGTLLNDITVLNAMEHNLLGKFMPVELGDTILKAKTDVLKTLDDFEQLYGRIQEIFAGYGKRMKSGYACASPTNAPGKDPCSYCKFKPICRNTKRRTDDSEQ